MNFTESQRKKLLGAYYISDFASLNNSPILDWENWRIQDGNPKNTLD